MTSDKRQNGLVLGKFSPLHTGHLKLIEWAAAQCHTLTVLICAADTETIDGSLRLHWLRCELGAIPTITVTLFAYKAADIPNTSVSSYEASAAWVQQLKPLLPATDCIFTSEPYGDSVAEIWGIQHRCYDQPRVHTPVSASMIQADPFRYWQYIPASVRLYYTRIVYLTGTESTGKTTLAQKLSVHFNTYCIEETARAIVAHTAQCTPSDLYVIATQHAAAVQQGLQKADKILLVDTDITMTRAYSRFLFNEVLEPEPTLQPIRVADLYIYLTKDAPFIQDGTRLDKTSRDRLDGYHIEEFTHQSIPLQYVSGDWEERFHQCVSLIQNRYFVPAGIPASLHN